MKRLAITIAGAVSLGSYESGVMYEIFDVLRQHNMHPETPPEQRIEVDVITGASAGGMTGIILAQKLLFAADEFHGPEDNPLYNCWVERIDLAGLMTPGVEEPALHSLFSSDLIETISKETLMARYGYGSDGPPGMPPAPVTHAAVGTSIHVGVTMTNLNGVDYGYPVEAGPAGADPKKPPSFVYTQFGDQRTRVIDVRDPQTDTAAFWEPLREAAVATGAFPVAFRARDILRSAKAETRDYPPAHLMEWPHDPHPYAYSDGGVLQNQPIGLAKNLVDEIDCHEDQENRFYLFVSPSGKVSTANDNFRASDADYVTLISRLMKVVFGQSGFQDWITAKEMNERIYLLDARADGLRDAMLAGAIDVACLRTTAGSLLQLFFPGGFHTPPGATEPETLQAAQGRIERQYAAEIKSLAGVAGAGEVFRDAVLTFETAAQLGARDEMRIYGITASDEELAGAGLQAFLGFFDRALREHDYTVGRHFARAFLRTQIHPESGHPELGPLRFSDGDTLPAVDHRLDGYKLSDLSPAARRFFKAGTRRRVNQMLAEQYHGWSPALEMVVDPVMDALLDGLMLKL